MYILIYLFPLFVVAAHLHWHNQFIRNNYILYILGFGLLLYTNITYHIKKNNKTDELARKVYFIYTFFFLLYIFPEIIDGSILWGSTASIAQLSSVISPIIVIFIISFVIYITIISDFNISEISFGSAKISLLKEKYNEEINSHFENANQLIKKIEVEGLLIQNMNEYCKNLMEKSEGEEIDIFTQYQILLSDYFNMQKENTKVYVLYSLKKNLLRKEFSLKDSEIDVLRYKLEHGEIYITFANKNYYLFIPFCYVFEELINDAKSVYIVLESQIPILCEAESRIIRNILIKFTDDLLKFSLIIN